MLKFVHSLHVALDKFLGCLDPLKVLLFNLYVLLLTFDWLHLFYTSLCLDNWLFWLQNRFKLILLPLLYKLFAINWFTLCQLYLFHLLLLQRYLRLYSSLSNLDTTLLYYRFPFQLFLLHLLKLSLLLFLLWYNLLTELSQTPLFLYVV